MSQFVVSARKYRPSTFETVVGQDALTTTLRNAIAADKLSHAYLFCGPRGVGKTSCARIFAKTINCEHRTASGEACNECESCIAANEQRSHNILELDAASNNSVNDIRQLIDQVYIAPSRGKYRVYIIDEVHMLSSSAFNAFLKTLEEPPAHAIFVLATTEKHKVLPTIISRCQVHDFNRITSGDIARHLQDIARKEGIEAEPEALQMIGIAADGGMRDALSMFDQIAGYGGGKITKAGVRQNLNLLDEDEYFSLLGYILKCDHPRVLSILDSLLTRGYEGEIIMRGFSNFLRNVLMAAYPDTLPLIEVPDSIRQRLATAAAYTPPHLLWSFLKISSAFSSQYRNNNEKRLVLEMAFLNMCELLPSSELNAPTPPVVGSGTATPQQSTPSQPTQSAPVQQVPPQQAPQPQGIESTPAPSVVSQPVASYQTPPPPAAPRPTTPPRTSATRPSGAPSMRQQMGFDLKTGKRSYTATVESTTATPQQNRSNPFTLEELQEVWAQYAYSHCRQMFVKGAMQQQRPELLPDGHTLRIIAYGQTQKTQFEAEQPALTSFLQNSLQNDHIRLQIELTEEPSTERRIITAPREKFQVMADENEWLRKFADTLGLEPIR